MRGVSNWRVGGLPEGVSAVALSEQQRLPYWGVESNGWLAIRWYAYQRSWLNHQ